MNNQTIVNIPVNKIKANKDNSKIFNMTNIEGLAESIKETGFNGSIEVIDLKDNTYEVISGHRRLEAAKLVGMKEIPAIVFQPLSDSDKAKRLILSNIHNRELTSMDRARAIEYFIDNVVRIENPKANVQEEAAKAFNISVTSVKYYRRLLKLHPQLQNLLEKELIPYVSVIDAVKLDDKEQCELAELMRKAIVLNNNHPLGQKNALELTTSLIKKKEIAVELKEKVVEPVSVPVFAGTIVTNESSNSSSEGLTIKTLKQQVDFGSMLDESEYEEFEDDSDYTIDLEDDDFMATEEQIKVKPIISPSGASFNMINLYSSINNVESLLKKMTLTKQQSADIRDKIESLLERL
jgi:ParB family chromosome partitioning protein